MRLPALLSASAAALLLTACAGTEGDPQVDAAVAETYANVPFAEALQEAYGAMAAYEARAGEAEDAAFFQEKMTQAGTGAVPDPDPAPTPELERARAALMIELQDRSSLPGRTATAQAAYDCWARDAGRGSTPAPVDCQALFTDTMRDIRAEG